MVGNGRRIEQATEPVEPVWGYDQAVDPGRLFQPEQEDGFRAVNVGDRTGSVAGDTEVRLVSEGTE